jgi:hypothetical protein
MIYHARNDFLTLPFLWRTITRVSFRRKKKDEVDPKAANGDAKGVAEVKPKDDKVRIALSCFENPVFAIYILRTNDH